MRTALRRAAIFLCLVVVLGEIGRVAAQESLTIGESIRGELTVDRPKLTYWFNTPVGQDIAASITVSDDIAVNLSLYNALGVYQASSMEVIGLPEQLTSILTTYLPIGGDYKLVAEALYNEHTPVSTTQFALELQTVQLFGDVYMSCAASSFRTGQFIRLREDARQYGGDPYISRNLGQMQSGDVYFRWGLHLLENPARLDVGQPVFLAEGPVCMAGDSIWRVRASKGDGKFTHFWIDEQDIDDLLPDPPANPYVPEVIILEESAPLMSVRKQIEYYAGGGGVGSVCFAPVPETSIAYFDSWYYFKTYIPLFETVSVSIIQPDGRVISPYAIDVNSDDCIPMKQVRWSIEVPFDSPLGVWTAEIETSQETRRLAFEVVPYTDTLNSRMVCRGYHRHVLVTGLPPHQGFNVVWLEVRGDVPLEGVLTARQRWSVMADEYGNALLQPAFAAHWADALVIEAFGWTWQDVIDRAYPPQISSWEELWDAQSLITHFETVCPLPDSATAAQRSPGDYGGEFSGTVDQETARYYAFSGQAGQHVDIHAVSQGDVGPDLVLDLSGPDGTLLFSNDDAENPVYGFFDPRIEMFELPVDGVYIITIRPMFGAGTFQLLMK